MPLTDLQCASAKPKTKQYKLADLNGLFLHIMPHGKRFWRYKYRLHGKEKTITLGQYPDTTLAEARDKRIAESKNVEKGYDPVLLRAEQKQIATYQAGKTFRLLAEEWHERTKDEWAERHANNIIYRLEKYVFPKIGEFPLTSITPQLLLSCLQNIEKTSPDIARRIIQYCSRIFKYAIVTGRFDRDLTIGLQSVMKKPKHGHVASIEIDELPKLITAMENDAHVAYRQNNLALRLMMLTFVRSRELLHAKWAEFNFENAMWTVPAERMKMRKVHLVPLSKQALAILYELKEINGKREFILPGISNPRKPISNNTLLSALNRMGYKGKMTGHGFRALAMGIIKERLDYRHEVIDRQLSHVPRSEVDRAYDRAKFLPQRTKMMQDYADYIDSLNQPKPQQRTDHDHKPDQTGFFTGQAVSYTTSYRLLTDERGTAIHSG